MSRLGGRLGPLVERDFRLLFTATTITTIGDRLATIALAFAVLEFGSATDLGLVLGARMVAETSVVLGGGVIADRLPRNLVMTGAALVQAAAQAVTAALVLSDGATVTTLVALQIVYGVGGGIVVPAEVGLVPQTVSAERLQEANALQGLSRNITGILGPAVGGAIVAAGSPGTALAVDAASFLFCAVLLARISVPPRAEGRGGSFFAELREGWTEFRSRDWLWASVLLFGVSNFVWVGSWSVLGPLVAKEELGGAGAWGVVLAVGGAGSILGGLLAYRVRPARPLVVSVLAPLPMTLPLVALALHAPVPVLAAAALVASAGLSLHITLWFTVIQREVPEHARSRVSAYDALGSFVLMPLGAAVVGPVAVAIGVAPTLWIAVGVMVACISAIAALPSVRAIRAPAEPDGELVPELTVAPPSISA